MLKEERRKKGREGEEFFLAETQRKVWPKEKRWVGTEKCNVER